MLMSTQYTINLSEVSLESLNLVGGKNASLGEMIQNLSQLGIHVPGGFAITVQAYREFLEYNKLDAVIHEIISKIDTNNLISLSRGGTQIRQLIRNGKFP